MKWIVIGAGRSGLGAKKLLEHHHHLAFLFDENKSKLPEDLHGITIDNTNHPIFSEKELGFIVSPGVSLKHEVLKRARERGQIILSEIDLALKYFHGNLIAVTGTNGKSTTVMMIAHLLKELNYEASIGGNIGIAASTLMLEKTLPKHLVLELSSYQIEASQLIHAHIAILTGLTPDHLQRHGTLKAYTEAKWRLFESQTSNDLAIIEKNIFHQATEEFHLPRPKSQILLVSESEIQKYEKLLHFPWKHDRFNAFCALAALSFLSKKPFEELAPLLKTYRGLEFRCEIIGKIGDWSIINDSKGTNMDSTLHALTNIHGKITLFLGGLSKEQSFLEILRFKDTIAQVLAFGQGGPKILEDLGEHIPVKKYARLSELMEHIGPILSEARGDLVFSPACASQDEFSDFEERGRFFTQHVHKALKDIPGSIIYEPIYKSKKG